MLGKMTRTRIVLILLVIVAVLSAIVLIAIPAIYHPTYTISAERLGQKPDTYFHLENPDNYVSQAISNPQESVIMDSLEDTQIDEMIEEHNTSNVQVNDIYYKIGIVFEDNFPTMFEYSLYCTSLVALPLSVVAIIFIIMSKVKRQISIRAKDASIKQK